MAAELVVSLVLETIRDLLLEEAKFLYGVGDQVREIQEQLQMMKSFLRDADQRQHNEELVRTWVQQVRRLANRTEDVLETYAVEVVSKKGSGGIKDVLKRFSCILSEGKSLHKVGTEIMKINSRIANLKADRETYGINALNEGENVKEAKARQRLLRQTYAHDVEDHFVGMKDDIRELVSLITDNERDYRVVSIWGMGGLGKTTLAKKIFNHGTIRGSFTTFAWVCITEQCQIAETLQDILSQLLGEKMEEKRVPTLVIKLHQVLEENNCLVVLDDIWKMEDLEILRPAFPIKNVSSRILLTTRSEDVAKKGLLYKLKSFTEEEGWELLRKKTINTPKEEDHETESTFEEIGREIVSKCGYLPLAISVIGGILREKSYIREWEAVNENITSYLRRGETSKSVLNVLSLSYDDLPYYLKPCFLYMGSFREDEKINVEKLYLLWIAEGLVLSEHCGDEESMMDVAEQYLNELSSRSMVIVGMDVMSIVPKVSSSQLHDLMRDLCLAKGREEQFLEVILLSHPDSVNENESLAEASSLLDRIRRLGFHIHHDIDYDTMMAHPGVIPDDIYRSFEELTYLKLLAQVKGKYLRTLLVRGNGVVIHLPDISDLKKFNLLRVIEFYKCRFEFAREVNQLIHLRYLSIEGSRVKKLPSSVSDFLYLQTLNLRTKGNTYIPNIFGKMKRLKHIYLPRKFKGSEKLQFKDLTELETLHGFEMPGNEAADLSGLVNLRSFSGRLEIHALSQIIDQIYSWKKIKAIEFKMFGDDLIHEESLVPLRKVLMCEKLDGLDITSHMVNFPPYEPQFLPNLTRMLLINTKFEEDPMQFLQKLPNLRKLTISYDVFMGKEIVCDAVGFPQLKFLKIEGLPNLEIWRVDEGAMPKLSHLYIRGCRSLKTITDGLKFSALEKFNLRSMHKEFKEKYGTLYDQERKKLDG